VASGLTLNRALAGLAALSLALGLWQLGGAAVIHGKAWLAQRLAELTQEEREVLRAAAPVIERLTRL